jgi:hypothetical protein
MSEIKIGSGGRHKKKAEPKQPPKRLGRPPKPKDQKTQHRLTGYVDRATNALFVKTIRRLGYSESEAIREAAMYWLQSLDNERPAA